PNIGSYSLFVKATDPYGASSEQPLSLTVAADTQSPTVSLVLSANPADLGTTVTIMLTATDNVGVDHLVLTVGGTNVALDSKGAATIPADTVGSFAVVASAYDAAGNPPATASATLQVIDPTETSDPVVGIAAPADQSLITAPTRITG